MFIPAYTFNNSFTFTVQPIEKELEFLKGAMGSHLLVVYSEKGCPLKIMVEFMKGERKS